MAAAEPDFERFRERVIGRRVNEESFQKYKRWAKRFEMWRRGGDPTLGDLIDFDSMLADADRTDYPWRNSVGRPAPDSYSYRSRVVALSAAKLWMRVQYDQKVEEEVQNIVSGDPEPFDPPYVSMDDIDRIIGDADRACSNPDCQTALAISYDAVLRASELVKLTVDDIDMENQSIYVHATKGSESGHISLGERAFRLLHRHLEREDPSSKVFTNAYGNGWKANSWATHVRRDHHEVGAHSIGRHSPIVHMLQHPERFEYIDESQDVFGQVYQRARHRYPSTTSKYAKVVGIDVPDWSG